MQPFVGQLFIVCARIAVYDSAPALLSFVRTYLKVTVGLQFACGIVKGDGGYADGNEAYRANTMDCWLGTTNLDDSSETISATIIEKDRPAASTKFKDLAAGKSMI